MSTTLSVHFNYGNLFHIFVYTHEKPGLTTICMRVCYRWEECKSERNIPISQLRSDHLVDKNVFLR